MSNAGKISPLTAAEAAEALGIKVYTIGAGSRGEVPVPVTDSKAIEDWSGRRLILTKIL